MDWQVCAKGKDRIPGNRWALWPWPLDGVPCCKGWSPWAGQAPFFLSLGAVGAADTQGQNTEASIVMAMGLPEPRDLCAGDQVTAGPGRAEG
jgi:hypothetical protein